MKRIHTNQLYLLLLISLAFFSCSVNQFSVRKNFQPRIRIEASVEQPSLPTPIIAKVGISRDSAEIKKQSIGEERGYSNSKPKETIIEKVVRKTFPNKQDILDRVFSPQKKSLKRTLDPEMDGSQVAGLVIGILAMCLAIASYLMIIVMINGGLYTGFIIGLVLAAAAMAMGFLGKRLPLGGISLAAGILAIVAVFVLMLFLVLIIVGVI